MMLFCAFVVKYQFNVSWNGKISISSQFVSSKQITFFSFLSGWNLLQQDTVLLF